MPGLSLILGNDVLSLRNAVLEGIADAVVQRPSSAQRARPGRTSDLPTAWVTDQ